MELLDAGVLRGTDLLVFLLGGLEPPSETEEIAYELERRSAPSAI